MIWINAGKNSPDLQKTQPAAFRSTTNKLDKMVKIIFSNFIQTYFTEVDITWKTYQNIPVGFVRKLKKFKDSFDSRSYSEAIKNLKYPHDWTFRDSKISGQDFRIDILLQHIQTTELLRV